jgi:prepilin-type N-terminal cleavage/methylation domain-containing protein
MSTDSPRSSRAGFTLVELLIALVVALLLLAVSVPALQNLISRQRLEGYARNVATLAQRARHEALTHGVPAVVAIDGDSVVAFVDLHGATLADPPDGLFNPDGTAPYRATDYEIGRHPAPKHVALEGIDGFTEVGDDRRAIFQTDGSISDTGGFRVNDVRGNRLDVRIAPRATGRVTMLKWDGSGWRANGEGGHSWSWN